MNHFIAAGIVAILNVTTGDTRLSFSSDDPGEVERAKAVVEDMLKRGYCLSVIVGDKMERVVGFDASKCDYLVESPKEAETVDTETSSKKKKGKKTRSRRSAKSHSTIAVGQTAGGGLGCYFFGLRKGMIESKKALL